MSTTQQVFERLGADDEPQVLVVGVRREDRENGDLVCLEPSDWTCPASVFTKVHARATELATLHALQNCPDKRPGHPPREPRRVAVKKAIEESLHEWDAANRYRSYVGEAIAVDNYDVVLVLHLPASLLERFPPVMRHETPDAGWSTPSLLDSVAGELLDAAAAELGRDDPGTHFGKRWPAHEEILARAADHFMYTPMVATGERFAAHGLFEHVNRLSLASYERHECRGRIAISRLPNPGLDVLLPLAEAFPIGGTKGARKLVQLSDSTVFPVATFEDYWVHLVALARPSKDVAPAPESIFFLDFLERGHWRLSSTERPLMETRDGVPRLPVLSLSEAVVRDTLRRTFPDQTDEERGRCLALITSAATVSGGSLVVVAADAASEADRLRASCTAISPAVAIGSEVLERIARVDGAVLLDPAGTCHAFGVILDGEHVPSGDRDRGSRYNSSLRYVNKRSRVAFVFSEDGHVTILPAVRKSMPRARVDTMLTTLESASTDAHRLVAYWLRRNRLYLRKEDCDRFNAQMKRLEEESKTTGRGGGFDNLEPDPAFDESYYT